MYFSLSFTSSSKRFDLIKFIRDQYLAILTYNLPDAFECGSIGILIQGSFNYALSYISNLLG